MITLEELQVKVTAQTQPYMDSMKRLRADTQKELDKLVKDMEVAQKREQAAVAAGNKGLATIHRNRYAVALKEYEQFTRNYLTRQRVFEQHVRQSALGTAAGGKGGGGGTGGLEHAMLGAFHGGALTKLVAGFTRTAVGALAPVGVIGTVAGALILEQLASALAAGAQMIGQQIVTAVQKAAEFERLRISLGAVEGSALRAGSSVARLEEIAINTPGLTFLNAVQGYQRLRAVQFSAQEAEKALVGLSKVKILSGSTEQDLQAVLINFAQIRSIGRLTGDELRETLGRMPYFAQVLEKAFGTISTRKIAELGLTAEETFELIFEAMETLPDVAGGATNAWEKFADEIYKAQVEFGTPFLEPVTRALEEFTDLLRSPEVANSWAVWGQAAADSIATIYKDLKSLGILIGLTSTRLASNAQKSGISAEHVQLVGDTALKAIAPMSPISWLLPATRDYLSSSIDRGREDRIVSEGRKMMFGGSRPPPPKTKEQIEQEQGAKEDEEVRRYKELNAQRKVLLDADISNLRDYYDRKEALIKSSNTRTIVDELVAARQIADVRVGEQEAVLARMERDYAESVRISNAVVAGYRPRFQDRARKVQDVELAKQSAKVEQQRTRVLKEQGDAQSRLAGLQDKYHELLRRTQIAELDIRERVTIDAADRQITLIEEGMSRQGAAYEEGYNRILAITQESYQELDRLRKEKNALELQDVSLLPQQVANIQAQQRQEELRFAEEHRRKIVDIEKKKTDAIIQEIERRGQETFQLQQGTLQAYGTGLGDSPLDRVRSGRLGEINQTVLNAQISSFDKLRENWRRASIDTASLTSRINILTKSYMDAEQALRTLEKAPDFAETAEVTQIRTNITRDRDAVLELQGALQAANSELQRFSGSMIALLPMRVISQDIGKLYEQLTEGTADYTIFDQIIEQSFRAQRAIEEAALVSKISTAQAQVQTLEGLKDPTGEVQAQAAKLRVEIAGLSTELGTFRAQTELGVLGLDNLSKAQAAFDALIDNGPATRAATRFQADLIMWEQRTEAIQNIRLLETKYYEDSTLWALRRHEALLNVNKEVWEQEQENIIRTQVAMERLNKTFEGVTQAVAADIAEYLQKQGDVAALTSDLITGSMDDFYGTVNTGIDLLIQKLGLAETALGNFVGAFLKAAAQIAATQLFKSLFSAILNIGAGAAVSGIGSAIGPGSAWANFGGGTFRPAGGGSLFGFAEGGWVGARPGGRLAHMAEGGYDELVLTTDPKYRGRNRQMVGQYLAATGMSGGGSGPTVIVNNNFHANKETGMFSKQSAEQSARRFMGTMDRFGRKGN